MSQFVLPKDYRSAGALLGLLAGLLSWPLSAATLSQPPPIRVAQQSSAVLYSVEILVFRASSVGAAEDWSSAAAGRGFGNTANRGGATPQVMRILPASEYKLSALEGALRASGAWRPIAHAAWIQTAANWGTRVGIALSDLGIDSPGLSGTVYLERAPIYMHLGFDVSLSAGTNYSIQEMRSIRYGDKQYFDHPAFGIIALVNAVKHTDGASTR